MNCTATRKYIIPKAEDGGIAWPFLKSTLYLDVDLKMKKLGISTQTHVVNLTLIIDEDKDNGIYTAYIEIKYDKNNTTQR